MIPIPWPVLMVLEICAAVEDAIHRAHLWGPPLLVVVLTAVVLRRSDSVRARVRTLLALVRIGSRPTSPTCTDTCPDTSVDTCPDVSGHSSTGGP